MVRSSLYRLDTGKFRARNRSGRCPCRGRRTIESRSRSYPPVESAMASRVSPGGETPPLPCHAPDILHKDSSPADSRTRILPHDHHPRSTATGPRPAAGEFPSNRALSWMLQLIATVERRPMLTPLLAVDISLGTNLRRATIRQSRNRARGASLLAIQGPGRDVGRPTHHCKTPTDSFQKQLCIC